MPPETAQSTMPESRQNKLIILLLAAILIVLVIIFITVRKSGSRDLVTDNQSTTPDTLLNDQVVAEWKSLSQTALINVVSQNNLGIMSESGIGLSQTADITGDGIDEAVFVGNGGNNDLSFIMMKAGNNQVIAQQKNKDGSIGPIELLSVGRVNFQEGWKLIPEEHGFYTESLAFQETSGKFVCNPNGVNAYVWNSSTKLFEWNQALTAKYTAQVCN